jgi:hypothetical protein
MKYLRLTGTPEPSKAPSLFELVADARYVTAARLRGWNLSGDESATLLFEIEGDFERFRTDLCDGPESVETEVTRITDDRFYLLATLTVPEIPLLRNALPVLFREALVVVPPVVYRDGQVHARFVGDSVTLQAAVADLPGDIHVDIRAVGEYDVSRDSLASSLSDRQREAVTTAFELGYYDHPRGATHEDVADRLGVAPTTASEHLQKAEAKILASTLESEFATDRA